MTEVVELRPRTESRVRMVRLKPHRQEKKRERAENKVGKQPEGSHTMKPGEKC